MQNKMSSRKQNDISTFLAMLGSMNYGVTIGMQSVEELSVASKSNEALAFLILQNMVTDPDRNTKGHIVSVLWRHTDCEYKYECCMFLK